MDGTSHESEPNDYDKAWEILKIATADFKAAGIPDHEVPPAAADYLVMSVLALGMSEGTSEIAVETIIKRMEAMLDDWRNGRPPFTEFNGLEG